VLITLLLIIPFLFCYLPLLIVILFRSSLVVFLTQEIGE
jgi:hypothetical protein